MTIKKIAYSKTYPISNLGVWEKIFLEAELIPDEDVRQSLYSLKKQVENFHFESNKADEKKAEPKIDHIGSDIYKAAGLTKDEITAKEISTCKEIKVLESYKFIVKGKPELETIYNNRLKELT